MPSKNEIIKNNDIVMGNKKEINKDDSSVLNLTNMIGDFKSNKINDIKGKYKDENESDDIFGINDIINDKGKKNYDERPFQNKNKINWNNDFELKDNNDNIDNKFSKDNKDPLIWERPPEYYNNNSKKKVLNNVVKNEVSSLAKKKVIKSMR